MDGHAGTLDDECGLFHHSWNAALTYDMVMTQPCCIEWSQLQVPTLLIIGELDKTALGKTW
jgi:hypothetical protein